MELEKVIEKDSLELCLMLACAVGNTPRIMELLKCSINWNNLFQLANQHEVYPLVYKSLSHIKYISIPDNFRGQLEQEYKSSGLRAYQMAIETVRIIKCLEDHGVYAVVLKGAPLACRLYGDVTVRPSKDIDILVKVEDLTKVQSILLNEGYQGMRSQALLTEKQLKIFLRLKNCRHFEYLHSEKKIQIEIHWDIGYGLPRPALNNLDIIQLLDCSILVLPNEEWLLFLIFHGSGHAWVRLRWLVDVALFIQQGNINWEKINIMAKKSEKISFFYQTLILLNELLNLPVPVYFQEDLKRDYLAVKLANMALSISLNPLDSLEKTIKHKRKYDAKFRTGWRNNAHHYLQLINPHVDDIRLIALPNLLFPLYYLIRPFTWVKRYYIKKRILVNKVKP